MAKPLLDPVLPAELADRQHVIEFKGDISDFPRLAEIVRGDLASLVAADRPRDWSTGRVTALLEFGWIDAERVLPGISGRLTASLFAVCQRCLQPFELLLDLPVNVVLVAADEAAAAGKVQRDAEIWDLEAPELVPRDFIEESLIMALPLAPMHDATSGCQPPVPLVAKAASEKVRPFATLRAQMEKPND